jgi:putative ABC transport system ATP-binding protein
VLAVERVSKSFSGARSRVVLHDVSLYLAAGEYIAVMGESGAGKSTLLNLIAGLDVPDSGRIVVAGQDLAALDDAGRTRLRRARMGFVFQAFHLLPHLTVGRNVGLPLALNGAASPQIDARVEEMLAAVGMLERRDVAIARALAHRPSLVLADEPTGNLDADSAAEVLRLLRAQLERDNAAGILVTHSEVAAATAQRTFRLTHQGLRERAS